MKLKQFLREIHIPSAFALASCRKLLLDAAAAAERMRAAEVLDATCKRWGDLPDDLKIDLWESAGEDNDDRNRITITVLTGDEELALQAIKVFAGSDYGKEDADEITRTAVWGEPAFMWEPGSDDSLCFRKVMDAVAEMAGPYSDTRTTIAEIRSWVARVKKEMERLFK